MYINIIVSQVLLHLFVWTIVIHKGHSIKQEA